LKLVEVEVLNQSFPYRLHKNYNLLSK
jgi:hypothetical protein